jgi:aryl-alcohol dehydrogenase-like predicted oxidoreductase
LTSYQPKESYGIEAIQEAYQFGCTFFDTAEAYGHRGIEESKNKSFSANWRKKQFLIKCTWRWIYENLSVCPFTRS